LERKNENVTAIGLSSTVPPLSDKTIDSFAKIATPSRARMCNAAVDLAIPVLGYQNISRD